MTEISNWKKVDIENTHIDDLTLSAPQGNFWQKMMGAIARKFGVVDAKLEKLEGALVSRGTKADKAALEATTNPSIGDYYTLEDDGSEWAWNGSEWYEVGNDDAVHKSGDETIEGVKTFRNTTGGHAAGETVTDLIIRNPEVDRGVPLESGRSFTRVILADAEGDTEDTQAGRLGLLEVLSPKTGGTEGEHLNLECYKFSSDPSDAMTHVGLKVGFDADSIPYANAPSTSTTREDGHDIVTRDFIPLDTRIVHTTGDETVDGKKTHTGNLSISKGIPTLDLYNTANASSYCDIRFHANPATTSITTVMRDMLRGDFILGHTCQGSGGWSTGADLTLSYSTGNFSLGAKAGEGATGRTLLGNSDGSLSWTGQPIQTTSDARLKTQPTTISDDILNAWGDVEWCGFQYLDAVATKGESAREHIGVVAQQICSAFEKHKLDACDFGIVCHEQRPAEEAEFEEDGRKVVRRTEAVDLWMVRYEEALALEAAYQRRRADRLEARVEALEKIVAEFAKAEEKE